MIMPKAPGLALRGWLALTWGLSPFLGRHLRKRLARGKEDPDRWREKLGYASLTRPDGRLVWLHAVGLGEVLALRGLIGRMQGLDPALHFLVTSGTRASAQVLARNLPPNTVHQFAPLDAPGPAKRFLDHWRPDLSVWAEQELWPGLVYRADRRGIPLALVNARMNDAAFARRRRGRAIYGDVLSRFRLISAQDDTTRRHLASLGATDVQVDGSLKQIAPPLADMPDARATLAGQIGDRPVWLAASTHGDDETLVIAAHKAYLVRHPHALLILAPRLPGRAGEILAAIRDADLTVTQHSRDEGPEAGTQIHLADSFGDMGVWYRLSPVAYIGGTNGPVEGHNPWEGARLSCAILHGPHVANFGADYSALELAGGARMVRDPASLCAALDDPDIVDMAARAHDASLGGMDRLDGLCKNLISLL